MQQFIYRITGPQSVERLEPLVQKLCAVSEGTEATDAGSDAAAEKRLDLVWETACEQSWRARHSQARVLNRLHNSAILEDKGNLAFLQLRMGCPVLETFVAPGGASQVLAWASRRWENNEASTSSQTSDWWVVKVARGNGGRDVWIMNAKNYSLVVAEFAKDDELVIQKYVHSPLLWKGKKFHFRAYSVLRADMSALLFSKAFILTAGQLYDANASADATKHITNLSINKRFVGHPGQVVCDLPSEYPLAFSQMKAMWREVAKASTPFMSQQTSATHFEFFGIDVIADTDGVCWLVEANRLPGLESSKNNKEAEDVMYDDMMESLLRLVLSPVLPSLAAPCASGGEWVGVWQGAEAVGTETWKNTFSWRAFTRRAENRTKVVLLQDSRPAPVPAPVHSGTCGVEGCTRLKEGAPTLRCSRCTQQLYCGPEHQKQHFPLHKKTCRAPAASPPPAPAPAPVPAPATATSRAAEAEEVRVGRCMFCGEQVQMRSEEEAVDHMRQCSALQEQLASKEQFTIPSILKDKVDASAFMNKK